MAQEEPNLADDHASLSDRSPTIAVAPTLSKSAQKKAIKAERYAALKLERRAREKEAKKQKKRLLAEKRAAADGGDDDERDVLLDSERASRRKRSRVDGNSFGARIVVDLGFDDKMTDKEITSLCSQLAYTYSANRRASYPFRLVYTSLNGQTKARLESMNEGGYKRWSNTEWWEEGYERLWSSQGDEKTRLSTKRTVVYLTADSEQELSELKEDETYIIGGLCDHNRYKNLCLNKADASEIRSARLPIGRYIASLPTRKVLTVNQVFEILVHWVEVRDWEQAFHAVIPKRKFQTKGKEKSGADVDDCGVDDDDELGQGSHALHSEDKHMSMVMVDGDSNSK